MAIKKTRQRQRGGPYSKFDKTKTLPREFQIVESGDPNSKDGRAVYIAFEAGEPKRLSTYEDMQEDIDNATEEIQGTLTAGVDEKIKEADAAITSAESAATKANTATTNANKATDSANKAADNANKAVENIQSKVAINDKQPSDTTAYSGNKIETEFLKKNGDSSKTAVTFEVATQRANIQPQDTLEVAFGKLAKFCGDLKSHAFTAPVNNLAGTNPDLALAAPQGSELKKQVDALNSALGTFAYWDNVSTGGNGAKSLIMSKAMRAEHMYLVLVRCLNGSTDLYPPYGYLLCMRLNAWKATLIGEEHEVISKEISSGKLTLTFKNTQHTRLVVYEVM